MPNPTKQALLNQFARVGKVLASPGRLDLLDLLAQGEKTVETLARQSGLTVKNTSAHLRALRAVSLVDTRREGTYVHYRMADPAVLRVLRGIQDLAHRHLTEVQEMVDGFFTDPDGFDPISPVELVARMERGEVTVLDVRPEDEYRSGHISGALSIPLRRLRARMTELPVAKEVVAYCRGPYCVLSVEAAAILRGEGFRVRRLDGGMPDWVDQGLGVTETSVFPSTP